MYLHCTEHNKMFDVRISNIKHSPVVFSLYANAQSALSLVETGKNNFGNATKRNKIIFSISEVIHSADHQQQQIYFKDPFRCSSRGVMCHGADAI